jgi:ribosomal protein L7Ae-like RNA K-turn-binding protein
MREKIHSYLGFAKKSGNLVSGYDACICGIQQKKIAFMILTADLSENTRKKMQKAVECDNVLFRTYGTIEKMQEMTGEVNKGIYGIKDPNLGMAIMNEIDRCALNGKKEE